MMSTVWKYTSQLKLLKLLTNSTAPDQPTQFGTWSYAMRDCCCCFQTNNSFVKVLTKLYNPCNCLPCASVALDKLN